MRPPTEMETRVARSEWERDRAEALDVLIKSGICSKDSAYRYCSMTWESLTEADRIERCKRVGHVIRAMRDPGHELTAAVCAPGEYRGDVVAAWKAMIDAASPPE